MRNHRSFYNQQQVPVPALQYFLQMLLHQQILHNQEVLQSDQPYLLHTCWQVVPDKRLLFQCQAAAVFLPL